MASLLRFSFALLLSVIPLVGCSTGARVSPSPFHQDYTTSRDGTLRYRLPLGWLDASRDPQAGSHTVWLIRYDYGVSLTVDEVKLDRNARRDLEETGLLPLAHLTMELMVGDSGAVLLHSPTVEFVGGKEVCSYDLVSGSSGERRRVSLVDTGKNVLAITTFVSPPADNGSDASLRELHDAFLRTVRW